jgi:hypothetical protein
MTHLIHRYRIALVTAAVLMLAACSASTAGPGNSEGLGDATQAEYQQRSIGFFATLPPPALAVPGDFSEAATLVASCLKTLGFSASTETLPGASATIAVQVQSPSQADELPEAHDACLTAGIDAGFILAEDDPRTAGARYEAWSAVGECLAANGFPAEPPPAVEVFKMSPDWRPYSALMPKALGDGATGIVVSPGAEVVPELEALLRASELCSMP